MTIIIFIIVLALLILVHELGHFFVAKKSGIRVDEFGIGFPPKVFGKKIGETEYTLNWFPIGGFVRIFGENPDEEDYDENKPGNERNFVMQPKYIQAMVLVAGVTMNVLFAFLLYTLAYSINMPTAIADDADLSNITNAKLLVESVLPDTPASNTLKVGDIIISLKTNQAKLISNDKPLTTTEVASFINKSNGNKITFNIIRRGKPMSISITPEKGILKDKPERYATGFSMTLVGMERLPLHKAVVAGAERTYTTSKDIVIGMWKLFTGIFKGTSDFSQVSGPIGIVNMVGDAASLGFTWLLTFTAFISLNLAVINLLPIPALDGGRLVFVAIEAITHKPIKPIVATRINQIGFATLLTLMLVVTIHDVIKLF